MAIPTSYYFLIVSLAIAVACSLIKFKLHVLHLKIMAVLLSVDFINEVLATFGYNFLKENFGIKNNLIIYNSFILVQMLAFAWYFFIIIRFKWFKKLAITFSCLYTLFWLISVVFLFGIYGWNSYLHVIGSAFVIMACSVYFWQLYTNDEIDSLSTNTEFWIAVALFIFYSGNLPYTALLNYLAINAENMAIQLGLLLRLLNIVMYSIIIYAFICLRINSMKLRS